MGGTNLEKRIEKALDSVRPYLNKDGGDVKVISIKGDKLTLKFEGNCSSCDMSNMTLRAGIEEAIKFNVPEITNVIAL
jgi:Fe-S cluster biogenesis protein NfuA